MAGTKANEAILSTRKRKGLAEEIPDLGRFLDKLAERVAPTTTISFERGGSRL